MPEKKSIDGNSLSFGTKGKNVASLHQVITSLGIEIDKDELKGQRFGETTKEAVRRIQLLTGLKPIGEIDQQMSGLLNGALERLKTNSSEKDVEAQADLGEYCVEGNVTDFDGMPLAGATVVAFACYLRESHELGQSETDDKGHYRICCTAGKVEQQSSIANVKTMAPDLQFRVLSKKGETLYTSEINFHVTSGATIHIPLGGASRKVPSEFINLGILLDPHLGKLCPEDFVEDEHFQDITLLAGKTGLSKTQIAFYSAAARLASSTGLPPKFFYGLFSQNIPPRASVTVLASTSKGVDFNFNTQRLLNSVLSTSDTVLAKAIEAAISKNIIPASYQSIAQDDLAKLAPMRTNAAFSATWGMGKTPIKKVLDSAGIHEEKQQKFMKLYSAWRGKSGNFWKNLGNNSNFSKEEVETLRFSTSIGVFTKGHMPLVNKLMDMRQQGKIKDSSDLVRVSVEEWKTLLSSSHNGQTIGVPANIPGKNDQDRIDNFANTLERKLERAYPTKAFTARLAEDKNSPFPEKDFLVKFLNTNPNFDLFNTNVDRYLKDNPSSTMVTSGANNDAPRNALNTCKRLINLGSRYAAVQPLLADGINSSYHIYAMGRSQFVNKYKNHPEIGLSQAETIFAKSEQTYALALSLAMNSNAIVLSGNPIAIRNIDRDKLQQVIKGYPKSGNPIAIKNIGHAQLQQAIKEYPNLETLFGSFDLCACDPSRTVLSPAAYLVDMLHFLSKRSANMLGQVGYVKDVLMKRRPDALTDENTALKEEYVKDVLMKRRPDIAQIKLNPANTNTVLPYIDLVNELLEDEVASVTDRKAVALKRQTTLSEDELNANPQYINNDAYEKLKNAIFPWILPFDLQLKEARAYLGQLGVDRVQLMRTFQKAPEMGSEQMINMAVEGLGLSEKEAGIIIGAEAHRPWEYWGLNENNSNIVDPINSKKISGTWIQVLSNVRILLARSGLTYQALTQLLNTVFINPKAAIQLTNNPPDSCDLDKMTVVGFDQDYEALDRLHLFVRLMRRLDWDVYTLDSAITLLQTTTGGGVNKLNNTFLRQLYAIKKAMKRFQIPANVAITLFGSIETRNIFDFPNQGDMRYSLYNSLFQNRDVLNPVDPTVLNPVDSIFKLKDDGTDINAITRNPPPLLADHKPILLGAFETSDADLTLVINSFTDGKLNLANLSSLYRHVVLARGLGISIKELISLKALFETDPKQAAAPYDPFDASRPELLAIFCDAVDKIRSTKFSIIELDYLLRRNFESTSGLEPDNATVGSLLKSIQDGLNKIAKENTLTPNLKRLQRIDLISQHLAGSLGLPATTTEGLVTKWFPSQVDSSKKMVEDFLILPEKGDFSLYFTYYTQLDQAAKVINGFGFSSDEVEWLQSNGANQGWLDLTKLPLKVQDNSGGRFVQWSRLADAAAVKKTLPSDGTPFTSLMDLALTGADKATYLKALSKRTQWSELDLYVLCGDPTKKIPNPNDANKEILDPGLLSLEYPKDYFSELALAKLMPAFNLLQRLGISADISGWIGQTVDANSIKQSLKAKYSSDQWLRIAKQLRDPLREQQRDALVAYLLVNPPAGVNRWNDVNDIYSHFLIDVEMSAFQGTSRIVQANSAIQLFVLRCLLNLESEVIVDADADTDWKQWKWLSRGRLREANLRVFLYPENWIEPSLRKDKSPFMIDLENDLLQNEVTKETAEDAFCNYLDKLDDVARLQVVGMYYDSGELMVSPPNKLTILPSPIILDQNGSQQFTAYLDGFTKIATWTAVGLIDEGNGKFTAPEAAGTYTVTATITVAGQIISATSKVTIREVFVKINEAPEGKYFMFLNTPLPTIHTFTAAVSGIINKEVLWTANYGSFSGNVYTAPRLPNGADTDHYQEVDKVTATVGTASDTVTVFALIPDRG